MTSKKSNRRKPKSGIAISVSKSGNSRAIRKAATAVKTAAAAANTALMKKVAAAEVAGKAMINKAADALKPSGVGIVAPKKVARTIVKK